MTYTNMCPDGVETFACQHMWYSVYGLDVFILLYLEGGGGYELIFPSFYSLQYKNVQLALHSISKQFVCAPSITHCFNGTIFTGDY